MRAAAKAGARRVLRIPLGVPVIEVVNAADVLEHLELKRLLIAQGATDLEQVVGCNHEGQVARRLLYTRKPIAETLFERRGQS